MTNNLVPISIERDKVLSPAENYQFLREKGMAYIRELAGKAWTDHNSHDPGITVMELLCFALTDLSYRTNFETRDLLALSDVERLAYDTAHPGHTKNDLAKLGLFEAHEILPTAPLTITDYRKLLLKIGKIQNAWLYPHCDIAEVLFYGDCENSKVTFSPLEASYTASGSTQYYMFEFENFGLYIGNHENITFEDLDFVNAIKIGNGLTYRVQATFSYGISSERQATEYVLFTFVVPKASFPGPTIKGQLAATGPTGIFYQYWKKKDGIANGDLYPVHLRGLYDVRIALDVDPELGPLNERYLSFKIPLQPLKGVIVMFEIPDLDPNKGIPNSITIGAIAATDNTEVTWSVNLTTNIGNLIGFIHIINDKPRSNMPALEITAPGLLTALGSLTTPDSILEAFWRKQGIINEAVKNVSTVLAAHRNLCEDFIKVDVVETQNIGICLDIETKNSGDLELLQAKMALKLEEYFNPPIRNYTLVEMLEDGLQSDEIFDGPYINYNFGGSLGAVFNKSGFLKTREVEASELRRVLYVSDIINILMDFEEIITVKDVMLRKFDKLGNPDGEAERWEMTIPLGKQPALKLGQSKFLFYKENVPYTAKVTEAEDTLNYLRSQASKNAYVPFNQIFEIQSGVNRNLDAFYPIQHDLPDTYGTSPVGIPFNSTQEKRRNVKNFKAYLLFFEQVLADYLQQLNNAKWLLSPNNSFTQSYFVKYIQDGDIAPLEDASFTNEYYIKNTLTNLPFLAEQKVRQNLYESDLNFLERRNEFLDHLLARFAESFADYSMMLFKVNGDLTLTEADLIDDKIGFLESYPKMSRERGTAFNYTIPIPIPTPIGSPWSTDNISGMERRFGRLVGIKNVMHRALSCAITNVLDSQDLVTAEKTGATRKFIVKHDKVVMVGNVATTTVEVLFKSIETIPDDAEVGQKKEAFSMVMRDYSNYSYNTVTKKLNVQYTYNNASLTLTSDATYNTIEEYYVAVDAIFNAYDEHLTKEACFNEMKEGMFLMEHILFRPMYDGFDDMLMPVCLDCETTCNCQEPYSFQISVILPYWPGRFNNLDFRSYFEKALREETPSHIIPKICWINNTQMKVLESQYKVWLDEKAKSPLVKDAYIDALTKLLDTMGQLKNVYPDATLHDCEEDGGDRPVLLGKTSLGSF